MLFKVPQLREGVGGGVFDIFYLSTLPLSGLATYGCLGSVSFLLSVFPLGMVKVRPRQASDGGSRSRSGNILSWLPCPGSTQLGVSLYHMESFLPTLTLYLSLAGFSNHSLPTTTYFFRPKGGKILFLLSSAPGVLPQSIHTLFSNPSIDLNVGLLLNALQLCSARTLFPNDKEDTESITYSRVLLYGTCL